MPCFFAMNVQSKPLAVQCQRTQSKIILSKEVKSKDRIQIEKAHLLENRVNVFAAIGVKQASSAQIHWCFLSNRERAYKKVRDSRRAIVRKNKKR